MREKLGVNQYKIVYWIAGLVVFLFVFVFTCKTRAQEPERQEYDIVVLGDSIMGQYRDETSIPSQLGALLGKKTFNGALGGTTMSRLDRDWRDAYTMDSLSVVGLTEAIAAGDFGVQQTARIRENATEYFAGTIDELQSIDFDKVETIVICAVVNDYHAGTDIYSDTDPYDEYTFAGALRSAIRNIREAYPEMRIVLVTATYTWYSHQNLTCEEYDLGGGILEKYVNAEIQVANEMGIEIIDIYHDFYPKQWDDWLLYTKDGLHPNDVGRAFIAETIADYLKEMD